MSKGQRITINRTRAVEWSDGVQLAPVSNVGIDLTSRTGYSQTGRLRFVWPKDHGGRLCGQFNYSQQSNPDTLVGSLAAK